MGMALGSKQPASDINVTPLIDVVLVLLIIFMVLTPLAEKQKFLRVPEFMPEAQPVPPDSVPPDQTVVTALKDGTVLLNKQQMSLADALARIAPAYLDRPSKVLFFNAEDDVKYDQVMRVLDALHQPQEAGGGNVNTIGMMTDPPITQHAVPAEAPPAEAAPQ